MRPTAAQARQLAEIRGLGEQPIPESAVEKAFWPIGEIILGDLLENKLITIRDDGIRILEVKP